MATGQGKVYVGNTPLILVTTGIDLTSVDTKILKILKPNTKNWINWDATVQAPAIDGILTYQCVAADLQVSGIYKLQAYVTFVGGKVYTGEMAQFKIYNLWE
jgi:hypothetical protein